MIEQSISEMVKNIDDSQILMFPGGFSAGDEPDGSGKFIATILNNPMISEAIAKFLERDGLILGICKRFPSTYKIGSSSIW